MKKTALMEKMEKEIAAQPEFAVTRDRIRLHARGEHFLDEERLVDPSQGSGMRVRKCLYPGCAYKKQGRKY